MTLMKLLGLYILILRKLLMALTMISLFGRTYTEVQLRLQSWNLRIRNTKD